MTVGMENEWARERNLNMPVCHREALKLPHGLPVCAAERLPHVVWRTPCARQHGVAVGEGMGEKGRGEGGEEGPCRSDSQAGIKQVQIWCKGGVKVVQSWCKAVGAKLV